MSRAIAYIGTGLVVAACAGCGAQIRDSVRGLVYLSAEDKVIGSWRAQPEVVFAAVEEAAREAFPAARIHALPGQYAVRLRLRDPLGGVPQQTAFVLVTREAADGTACDLAVEPLQSTPGVAPHDRRYPPLELFLAHLEALCRERGIAPLPLPETPRDDPPWKP